MQPESAEKINPSTTDGNRALAEWAQKQGLNNRDLKPFTFAGHNRESDLLLLPDTKGGLKVEDLAPFILDAPRRKIGDTKLLNLASFIRFVNDQKHPETRIFAQILKAPFTFRAVFDFDPPAAAGDEGGWQEHSATLELQHSSRWLAWTAKNNALQRQAEFAEFLKDNRLDVAEPRGSDVLAIVMALEATQDGRFIGKVQTNAGQTLSFEENTRTNIPIPDQLVLRLPLFAGGEDITVAADFKLRVSGTNCQFAVRLLELDRIVNEAVHAAAAAIEEATKVPVLW